MTDNQKVFSMTMSRNKKDDSFRADLQEIETDAHITSGLISRLERIVNHIAYEEELFKLTITVVITPKTFIDRTRVSLVYYAKLTSIKSYYDDEILKETTDLGKL